MHSFEIVLTLILVALILGGCNIDSKNRVIYEDGTPVIKARVLQWSEEVDLKGVTNTEGYWTFKVPVASEWNLCIENPLDENSLCCYNGLLTVDETGELIDVD